MVKEKVDEAIETFIDNPIATSKLSRFDYMLVRT